jgi:hypothetical protein
MRLAERHERGAGAEVGVHETTEGACGGVLDACIVGTVAKSGNVCSETVERKRSKRDEPR